MRKRYPINGREAMLELRVKLPHLSKENPRFDLLKDEIIQSVVRRSEIPAFAMRNHEDSVEIVEVPDKSVSRETK